MNRLSKTMRTKRTIGGALLVALTLPIIGLPAWCQPGAITNVPAASIPADVNGLNPSVNLGGTTESAPPKQSIVQDNLNLPELTTVLTPGASLGGPASNQILEPPINDLLNQLNEVTQNINTGKDALNQSITNDNKGTYFEVGQTFTVGSGHIAGHEVEYLGEGQEGQHVFRDLTTGQIIVGSAPNQKERLSRAQQEAALNLNNPDQAEQAQAQEEAGNALNATDPAETATASEEAAATLDGGEPGSGSGGSSGSSSGSARSPEEEAAEVISGENEGASGSGSTASGGGSSGGIFQDPTKGGSGPGVQQAVDAAENVKNAGRNINVNEEIVGGAVGNLAGNRLPGVDANAFELAPAGLMANASGGFAEGVSPFSTANGTQAIPGVGEAVNTGVVRSLQTGTKGGALPVEEANFPGGIRTGKATGASSANLSELEAEGAVNAVANKVRINTPAIENEVLNETTIRAPRR